MGAAPAVIEHLDAVVASVGHGDQAAVRCKGDGTRPAELPVALARPAEPVGERAVDVEHLDAVVASVGHGEHAAVGDGDVLRRRELAGAVAG